MCERETVDSSRSRTGAESVGQQPSWLSSGAAATGGPEEGAVPPLSTGSDGGDSGDRSGERCVGEAAAAAAAFGPPRLATARVTGGAGEDARVTPTGGATEAAPKGVPPSN